MSEREQFEKWWREWTHVHMTDKSLAWSAWEAACNALSRPGVEEAARALVDALNAAYPTVRNDALGWNLVNKRDNLRAALSRESLEPRDAAGKASPNEPTAVTPVADSAGVTTGSCPGGSSLPTPPQACPSCTSDQPGKRYSDDPGHLCGDPWHDASLCSSCGEPKDCPKVYEEAGGAYCWSCSDPFHAAPAPSKAADDPVAWKCQQCGLEAKLSESLGMAYHVKLMHPKPAPSKPASPSELERAARVCDEIAKGNICDGETPETISSDWRAGGVKGAMMCAAAIRALPPSAPPADEVAVEITEDNAKPLVAAMREADEAYQLSGGGTNHYVRECLLPALKKHGLALLSRRGR